MADTEKKLITDEMSDSIIAAAEEIVTSEGAQELNVRRLLQMLGISNRVFYNRFHNIDEVLEIVYKKTVLKIRQSLSAVNYDGKKDFFEHVKDVVANSLIMSYDKKMRFNSYVFESDSLSQSNYEWWREEISKLIDYAKEHGYIREIDTDIMSYSIWCFCRGYNADAVGRGLPKEEAVRKFRYSFGILLDGMKAQRAK